MLSGLLWRGPPYGVLTHIGNNPGIQLFSSQALLDELADVLVRPSPAKRLELIHKTALEVLADYLSAVTVLQPQPLAPLDKLTARECEIVGRCANGETYSAIRVALALSPTTVRNHISHCFEKLDVKNKAELANLLGNRRDANAATT